MSKIRRFPSLRDVFERERTEVSRESCPSLVSTSLLRREGPSITPLSVPPGDSVSAPEFARIGQNKKSDCKHPPKILSQPKFSDEDRSKWKGKSVSGRVAIIVSEEGDVTQARVVSASPKEAAESLLNAAKQAKFGPRPGCGELKTEVVSDLRPADHE